MNYRGIARSAAPTAQIGVSVLKRSMRLKADEETLPADRLRFSEGLPDEFFRQLCAERFDPVAGWQKHYDRNEALDVMNEATAAAMHQSVQIHRLRELDWQRLEQLYEPPAGTKAVVLPDKVSVPVAGVDRFPILSAKVN